MHHGFLDQFRAVTDQAANSSVNVKCAAQPFKPVDRASLDDARGIHPILEWEPGPALHVLFRLLILLEQRMNISDQIEKDNTMSAEVWWIA